MFFVGLDLGSTYTVTAVYNEKTEELKSVISDMESPYVPSVAAWDGKKMQFGIMAKDHAGMKGYRLFRAFKMLLSETDPAVLAEHGYTDEFTPEKVAELFISNLLKKVMGSLGEQVIDRLIVGAPEIWFQTLSTMSGRVILKDICSRLPMLAASDNNHSDGVHLQVVSEPAAACAFFAYNYQQMNKDPFEGQILLIDYGGGTLDINLAKVTCTRQEGGRQFMEIRVIESNGAGENRDGHIGSAGILYMEKLVAEAIAQQQPQYAENLDTADGGFQHAVNEVEKQLKYCTEDIEDIFDTHGISNPSLVDELTMRDLDSIDFARIRYKDATLQISYGHLVRVYNQYIYPTFDKMLQEMIGNLEKHEIPYQTITDDTFKISLVGGFCNFSLVKKQVESTFSLSHSSRVMGGLMKDKTDREQAIAKGCALIAAGVVGIRQTAPFSIGILQHDPYTYEKYVHYAFLYKHDIEYGKIYYPYTYDNKGNKEYMTTVFGGDGLGQFVINQSGTDRPGATVVAKEEYLQKLKNMPHIGVIGFSLDASETLTIHVAGYDYLKNEINHTATISLGRYNEFFEISKFEPIENQYFEGKKI